MAERKKRGLGRGVQAALEQLQDRANAESLAAMDKLGLDFLENDLKNFIADPERTLPIKSKGPPKRYEDERQAAIKLLKTVEMERRRR